jgi:hypothetical protein
MTTNRETKSKNLNRIRKLILTSGVLLVATTASAQDILQKRAFGTMRGTACVGPLSPSSDEGVQIVGSTTGSALTWQVFSVSSQTADALVFETTGTSVDAVVEPEGNLLYHACVVRSGTTGQGFELVLNSEEVAGGYSPPPDDATIDQQRAFGAMRGVVCVGPLFPSSGADVQIFGFTNGTRRLTWQVFSEHTTGDVLEFQQTRRNVSTVVPSVDGVLYHACVQGNASSFDVVINSQALE